MSQYPPPNMRHLVQRVEGAGADRFSRDWTGNDTSARQHHSIVSLSEGRLRLRLSWKKSRDDSPRVVGVFDLQLQQLLDKQFVRVEKGVENAIRLRFYHDPDGMIYIQVNRKGPKLPIGKVQ
jgi:hypothetical protein